VIIRPATGDDSPFLCQVVAYAADWRPGTPPRTVAEVAASAELAHYIVGWPRPGDVGVVAVDDDHDGGRPIGAAWWRSFSADDPGYGFVDEMTPELSLGVVPTARGRGVGTELMRALVAEARARSLAALSLSVEIDNPATRLYARLGFRTSVEADGAQTMILRLGD